MYNQVSVSDFDDCECDIRTLSRTRCGYALPEYKIPESYLIGSDVGYLDFLIQK